MEKSTIQKKKNVCDNKIEENEEKGHIANNRRSQLNNILGEHEEVIQVLQDVEIKDKVHNEKIKSKKIEKKVEQYHIENVQLKDLDETITTFADEDEKKKVQVN